MKALILSANTGGGHNSCAKAIQDVFIAHNEVCDKQDCLALISEDVSKTVASGHIFIYRHAPWIMNLYYKGDIEKKSNDLFNNKSLLFKFLSLGVPKLHDLIEANGYDTIICTHIFAALMFTSLQEKYNLPLISCQITTDYDCSANSKNTSIDFYFIPDKSLTENFVQIGIPKEKIYASGLPVSKELFQNSNKEEEKIKLGIPKESKHLLVMGGSMGGGPLAKATKLLLESLDDNVYLSVICGSNETLYEELSQKYGEKTNVKIYGFTDQVPVLMKSADLFFTKPGGLSTSEAYACHLPMALLNFIGGFETDNVNFFKNLGGAISEKEPEKLVEETIDLLKKPSKLQEMSKALEEASKGRGIPEEFIYKTLKEASPKVSLTSQE